MDMTNRSLLCPQPPAFQERGDPMDARHDHMGRITAGCDILGPMLVAAPLEAAVSLSAIGVDDAGLRYRRSNASFKAAG